MKNLVIVESPAKAKTIETFLGKDYKVMSSYGHIRDLKKRGFSIDFDNDYEPVYEIPADKKSLVKDLKAAAADADMVWLASDEDREGEAIAWHLYEVLGLTPERTRRIVFHEITKPAILAAIENPRGIDIDRVNAQQARRVLDRIVGFELSPVLWKKIKPALSAGRVQSVAVRLICEREKEIRAFVAEPFYRVTATFDTTDGTPVKAELDRRLPNEKAAQSLLEDCAKATFSINAVTTKPLKRAPAPPFTTSMLQQEAARKLGFSVNQTMSTAQKLYEAGHITYMRTDSMNLSKLALADIANTIKTTLGEQYLHTRQYHTSSKGAQEAHEAIRPTYISKETVAGSAHEKALYTLIRKRTLASQMADAELLKTSVEIGISNREEKFETSAEVITFDGFLRVYNTEDNDSDNVISTRLQEGEKLVADEITATERFTQAPPRYSEGMLVKKMEDLGIGRPSTYAPTISTIQTRDYVEKGERPGVRREYHQLMLSDGKITEKTLSENTGSEKGKLVPTDVGMVVNDFLTTYFPDILDYNFTAKVEEKFDDIAEGKLGWKAEIDDFYGNFHPSIEKINSMRMEHKVGNRELGTDPKTGRTVSVKIGRFGPVVQIGDAEDENKPLFASLQKGQTMSSITLEEALKLFELPRTVGQFEDKDVVAAVGKFGPYLRHDKVFVSIPKTLAPQTITIDEAIELIEAKRNEDANKLIKEYAEMPGLQLLNGRYGPYLAYKPDDKKKAVNYRLPKGTDVSALTYEDARKIMEKQDSAPAKKTRKSK